MERREGSDLTFEDIFRIIGKPFEPQRGMCSCPFHEENIPSFSFDDNIWGYRCFSCGMKGTPLTLYVDYMRDIENVNVTYEEAKARLGITLNVQRKKRDLFDLTLKRPKNLEPQGKLPPYMRFEGLDRIRNIQGYAVEGEAFEMLL